MVGRNCGFIAVLSLIFLTGPSVVAPGQVLKRPKAQEQQPEYNPWEAEKNLRVGDFYFKRKNYDAAIARYKDALRYKPDYGLAFKRMGEAYEEKKEYAEAIAVYEKYLDVMKKAGDEGKIRDKISDLKKKAS